MLSQSTDQLYRQDPGPPGRRTWRMIFRLTCLAMLVTILSLNAVLVVRTSGGYDFSTLETGLVGIGSTITSQDKTLKGIDEGVGKIYKQTVLDTPLALNSFETNVMQGLSSISYQIHIAQNGSNCDTPIHDTAFSGGINTQLYVGQGLTNTDFSLSKFLEHVNFIPAPTTGRGCTRIPSFHIGPTHWCYTHNVILNGCADHSTSHQYLAMGTIRLSQSRHVYFSTIRSVNLEDGVNRKSCSIVATKFGCDMLCSVVSERESADYNSPDPTPMVHGRLDFGGVYKEEYLPVNQLFQDWAANYPGVGSGEIYNGRIYFPVYGGVKQDSPTYRRNQDRYAIYGRYNNTCPDPLETQVRNAKASYTPAIFGRRMVQQAVISLDLDLPLGKNALLSVADNNITLMGAESRIINIKGKLYLYQRGTSWYPVCTMYPLAITNGTVKFSTPHTFDTFTRPGVNPCSAASRCPNSCVTGVYTDGFPLVFDNSGNVLAVYGMYLSDKTQRLGPKAGIFFRHSMTNVTNVSTPPHKAAYTTSTCFQDVNSRRTYCISIAEIGNSIFGEFRIVPLLVEVNFNKRSDKASSFTLNTTLPMD
ncbi:HN [Antarctic penguin virus C]|uniref:Hemagglutinin-neuraminidase n=1 Tax=Antarctic penguin virus C TaxID=2006074 RepID=A0A1Y0KCC8_9MONO|nr:HN [Antarctic penguin virus C]ARU83022.1 HN [Antarctic penguin virus C]